MSRPTPFEETVETLRAIRELGANELTGVFKFVRSTNTEIANDAVLALASSRNRSAPGSLLNRFWNDLTDAQRDDTNIKAVSRLT